MLSLFDMVIVVSVVISSLSSLFMGDFLSVLKMK